MSKGQSLLRELRFQYRPGRTRLDPRRHGARFDFEHAVESPEIQAQHPAVAVVDFAFDATDHTGATTKRDDGDFGIGRPIEQRADLSLSPGRGHEIGRRTEIATKAAEHVTVGSAVGMPNSGFMFIADNPREASRRAQSRRPELDRPQRRGLIASLRCKSKHQLGVFPNRLA